MSVSNELAPSRNKAGLSQRSPSSSFIRISQSSACFAARIPPAGLNPTLAPVRISYSRIIRAITTPTGSTALTGSFPVDVLMKSAPAISATMLARDDGGSRLHQDVHGEGAGSRHHRDHAGARDVRQGRDDGG